MNPYIITPHGTGQESFAWWDKGFEDNELNILQLKARNSDISGQVGSGSGGVVDPTVRRSSLSWMQPSEDNMWVYNKLSNIISTLNSQFFRFDLTMFGEALQLTNYNSENKGMYGWHTDHSMNTGQPCRKLSVVLQLSDPSEYEGGNLELKVANNDSIRMKKQRGLVVVFPSWTLHQVTPVTSGSRQSLVAWITGPAFK